MATNIFCYYSALPNYSQYVMVSRAHIFLFVLFANSLGINLARPLKTRVKLVKIYLAMTGYREVLLLLSFNYRRTMKVGGSYILLGVKYNNFAYIF